MSSKIHVDASAKAFKQPLQRIRKSVTTTKMAICIAITASSVEDPTQGHLLMVRSRPRKSKAQALFELPSGKVLDDDETAIASIERIVRETTKLRVLGILGTFGETEVEKEKNTTWFKVVVEVDGGILADVQLCPDSHQGAQWAPIEDGLEGYPMSERTSSWAREALSALEEYVSLCFVDSLEHSIDWPQCSINFVVSFGRIGRTYIISLLSTNSLPRIWNSDRSLAKDPLSEPLAELHRQ